MEFIRENLLKILIFLGVIVVAIIVFTLIFGRKTVANNSSYLAMENSLLTASKKYANNNQKILPKKDNETTKITLDTLVKAGYISELTAIDDKNVVCTGYVSISYENKKYSLVPYLKCGKYYETSTLASYIKHNAEVVTSSDGLYKVSDDYYVYKGEKPNNYIQVGDRLYRIMEINGNDVKLISNKKIYSYTTWDDRFNTEKDRNYGINDYSKSRLKEYFVELLKNKTTDYEQATFSEEELEKMVPHDLCIGKRSMSQGEISDRNECLLKEENQKLSLITVSDYAKASLDPNCNSIFSQSCANYNYLSAISTSYRTITATSDNTYQIFTISDGAAKLANASNSFSINLVIYLGNSSLYSSGDGSLEDPYIIR